MSKFKIGDRVKVVNTFLRAGQIGTTVKIHETDGANIQFEGSSTPLYYGTCVLELIKMQEKKTKTIKKYAVVWKDSDDNVRASQSFFTKEELSALEKRGGYLEGFYHIVPTLFIEEEVPVQTETVYNFICYNGVRYYATQGKYKDLETAKLNCAEAIQRIDSSAEEVEIE